MADRERDLDHTVVEAFSESVGKFHQAAAHARKASGGRGLKPARVRHVETRERQFKQRERAA